MKFRECGDLLHENRFPVEMTKIANRSYVRPAILHGSDVAHEKMRWNCEEESESCDEGDA